MIHIQKILVCLFVTATTVACLYLYGIVGFHYTRRVDNQVLNSPVRVVGWSKNQLQLGDGRAITFAEADVSWLESSIRESGGEVEVKTLRDTDVALYVKRKLFLCGMGAPCLTIPLIPVDIPKYGSRDFAIFGQIVLH